MKGARRRRGKPRLDQHMRSNLEACTIIQIPFVCVTGAALENSV